MKKPKKPAIKYKITSIVVPPNLFSVMEKDIKDRKKTESINFSSLVCDILYQYYKNAGKIK